MTKPSSWPTLNGPYKSQPTFGSSNPVLRSSHDENKSMNRISRIEKNKRLLQSTKQKVGRKMWNRSSATNSHANTTEANQQGIADRVMNACTLKISEMMTIMQNQLSQQLDGQRQMFEKLEGLVQKASSETQKPQATSLPTAKLHHGSIDKDCWVIWNNPVYDKLKLLRRMKTIKFNEWEDFVERDGLIWRRHFEIKEKFKNNKVQDNKRAYINEVDYICPVTHAKEFLGKTLQKIREQSFKNKEVSMDMLNRMLEGVSKGNLSPYQQDLLFKKKEIVVKPKSKINSPFWWLNLDVYRNLSLLVEMKFLTKAEWDGYMKKVMYINDSTQDEAERAHKIISFGEEIIREIKKKTSCDKWFQFVRKSKIEGPLT